MKRKILYRGQRIDNSEWVYGDLIHQSNGEFSIVKCQVFTVDSSYLVIPETIGQITGIKDIEENELYEGDIFLGHEVRNGKVNKSLMVVKWVDFGFIAEEITGSIGDSWLCLFESKPNKSPATTIELKCNIFENSELLKCTSV